MPTRLRFAARRRLAGGLVALALLGACQKGKVGFLNTDVTGADFGRALALTDHTGKARTLEDFRGKVVVIFFGFTQCPDVCPTTLTTMREAMSLLGEDAKRVQVLFATVDPARDTPQLLAQYLPNFHPSFLGLLGTEATIAATAKDFKVFYVKQPGKTADTYSVDHSTGSYAFDPQGKLRLLLRHGETPANVAADLKLLLAGK